MTADEHPKPQVTIEALAKLPSVFKKGKCLHSFALFIVLKWFVKAFVQCLKSELVWSLNFCVFNFQTNMNFRNPSFWCFGFQTQNIESFSLSWSSFSVVWNPYLFRFQTLLYTKPFTVLVQNIPSSGFQMIVICSVLEYVVQILKGQLALSYNFIGRHLHTKKTLFHAYCLLPTNLYWVDGAIHLRLSLSCF